MSQFPGQTPLPPPQYPTPYEPPRFGDGRHWPPPAELTAPSRRAALLLFILGGLAVALALMMIGAGRYVPEEAIRQSQANWPKTAGAPPSIAELRSDMIYAGIALAIIGGIFVALGLAVRLGGKTSAIIAIGTSGVAIVWLAWIAVSALSFGGNSSGALCALSAVAPPIVLFALVIRALLQSVSGNRKLASYYQHAAMQEMYRTQPPPPPPSAPESIPDYNIPPPPPPSKPQ